MLAAAPPQLNLSARTEPVLPPVNMPKIPSQTTIATETHCTTAKLITEALRRSIRKVQHAIGSVRRAVKWVSFVIAKVHRTATFQMFCCVEHRFGVFIQIRAL